jgi:hypothetical protein
VAAASRYVLELIEKWVNSDSSFIAILGGPLVTIGLFIFAWTVYPDVHWIAPIIGSAVFGAG